MKPFNLIIITLFVALFSSCFTNKCGDNVLLGEFELESESIGNWFPYLDQDELVFENSNGETITLTIALKINDVGYQQLGETCNEGWGDRSEEYYLGRWLQIIYRTTHEGIDYAVEALLHVDHSTQTTRLKLFDYLRYSSLVRRLGEETGVGGSVAMIANSRGNTFTSGEVFIPSSQEFAQEFVINGVTYNDVYYFNRAGVPSLIVQQGVGIIAFADVNLSLWVIKQN